MREKAVLVSIDFNSRRAPSGAHTAGEAVEGLVAARRVPGTVEEGARELEELSHSAGLLPVKSIIYRQKNPTAALLLGKGKVEALKNLITQEKANVLIFESNLSSTQQRNLEEIVSVKTIDRTQLILDIFAQRARSTEGKLQVELAQLKYLLPRLSGKGIYLSRLGGGVGTRGPGEQKLEVDRRRIRERISRLGRELAALDKRRLAGIERKKEMDFPLVAIVGYTNAGKSSLFNALTSARVAVQDRQFSTLETTTRLLVLPGNQKALLADTVGFVRDLPHHLVEAFKATLEETVQADILLHVMDASRPDLDFVERAVRKVLVELGATEKEVILVFNKSDLLDDASRRRIVEHPHWKEGVFVSALKQEGLEVLLQRLSHGLGHERRLVEFFVPKEQLGKLHFLYEKADILKREDDPAGSRLIVNISPKIEALFRKKLLIE